MDEIFFKIHAEDEDLSDVDLTHKQMVKEYKREFIFLTDRVYNSCLIYFELKGVPLYIQEFKENYKALLPKDQNHELADLVYSDSFTDSESRITKIFKQKLYPFRAFGTGDEAHLTGLDYLEKILNSTNRVLSERGAKPTQESEVYSNVRIVVEATFSNTKASFPGGTKVINQMAQGYIPDILIPDLQCAIEYKYAVSEKDLNTKMDQVLADVRGYDNHSIYKWFYAVFYVKTGEISIDRFNQLWQTKLFPSNWKPIFVEGPTYDKPRRKYTKKKSAP